MSTYITSVAQATLPVKSKISTTDGYLRVAEQGRTWFTVHIFRNTAHMQDWLASHPMQFVPLYSARGRRIVGRGGTINHTAEPHGIKELATEAQL